MIAFNYLEDINIHYCTDYKKEFKKLSRLFE